MWDLSNGVKVQDRCLVKRNTVEILGRLGYARQVDPFPCRDLQDLLLTKKI
jgi:hypothetical protein